MNIKSVPDPELVFLANQSRHLKFSTNLSEPGQQSVKLLRSQNRPMRNVHLRRGSGWAVVIFLGGANRTLGIGPATDELFRFADMCLVHFAKYRVRGDATITDGRMNISLAQAKSDLANESDAMAHIQRIEKHLIDQGALPDAETLAKQREADKLRVRAGRTLRAEFVEYQKSTDAQISELRQQLSLLTTPNIFPAVIPPEAPLKPATVPWCAGDNPLFATF